MARSIFILILFLLTNRSTSWGQPFYFTQYQVEEGLSNNAVFCSIQDKNGFMWFGTRDGLNRFDGYTFKIFQNDFNSNEAVQSNFMRALKEDHNGKIWVGTDQGIFIFDPVREKPILFDPSVTGEILEIKEDSWGNIWFTSDLTLFKFERKADSIIRISPAQNISAFTISTDGEEIWAATISGEVAHYSSLGKEIEKYSVFNNQPSLIDRRIEKLYYTIDAELIIGTRKEGIKLFDTRSKTYKSLLHKDYKNESLFVRDIIHIKESQYWFATESGIVVLDLKSNKYHFIKKEKESARGLSDNAVYSLCKDSEGAIWAGTYFGGINYFSEKNTFFEKFQPKSKANSISGYAVREITEDKEGNLWIGTEDNGLNKFEPKKNKFTHFTPDKKPGSIAHSNIHGLLVSGDTLWIGTFEHGLDLMNIKTGKVIRHYNAHDRAGTLGNNFIFNILKTRKGDILLATGRGLYIFEPDKGTFHLNEAFPDYIFYTTLYEDNKGTIWAGTWRDGLYYFNQHTKISGKLVPDSRDAESLRSNRINRIFQDSKNRIWIATEGGLSKLKDGHNTFTHYTTQNGFPSNLILSLLEDKNGLLWVSTAKGMVRFDPDNEEVITMSIANGLLSNQFNYNSSFSDPAGNFYFGSVKGLVRFNPKNYPKINYAAPVYITGIQIQNQEVKIGDDNSPLDSAITFTKRISLKHNQATFSIDFAALGYDAPAMTQYAYKMEGLDKGWNYLKTNRKVFFTNLPAGNYTFKVNVVDQQGKFKGKQTALYIEIIPPFWKSATAYSLYILLTAVSIFFMIRNYDKKIKERNRRRMDSMKLERERSLYRAKIDFFTLIAHEIRTPLTLIKAPLEKAILNTAQNQTVQKHLRLIERNTDRLITLSGQLLDFRKVEAHGFRLNFKSINVSELLREIYHNFQGSVNDKRFLIETTGEDIFAETDEEALQKIITNLTDNALKYSDTFVKLQLTDLIIEDCPKMQIKIYNDGQRVPDHLREEVFKPFYRIKNKNFKQGTGLGLPLSRSLAELLNGSLDLMQHEDNLNTFNLILPLIQSKHG